MEQFLILLFKNYYKYFQRKNEVQPPNSVVIFIKESR